MRHWPFASIVLMAVLALAGLPSSATEVGPVPDAATAPRAGTATGPETLAVPAARAEAATSPTAPERSTKDGGSPTDTRGSEVTAAATGAVPAQPDTTEGEVAVSWDPHARTLSAHADDVSIDALAAALEAQGVEIKTHESWKDQRITADFDPLPLAKGTAQLFGTGFVLTWSEPPPTEADQPAARARPRIILLPFVDAGSGPGGSDTVAGKPPTSSEALENLAASGSPEEVAPALESALAGSDEALRATAMDLLAHDLRLEVPHALLRDIADLDPDPAVRRQALGVLLGRTGPSALEVLMDGVDPSALEAQGAPQGSTEGQNAQGSTSVSTTALASTTAADTSQATSSNNTASESGSEPDAGSDQPAYDMKQKCQEIMGSLSNDEMNWLFKTHLGMAAPNC